MITINTTTPSPAVEGSRPTHTAPKPGTSTRPSADSIQMSSAALSAAKAVAQEATETADQTAREARAGDHQAQRLMAKYAAQQAMQH